MKTHLNLATTDLAESVAFYSVLLDAKPAKALADYALFVTERPPLELALDLAASAEPASGVHFGICVDSEAEVDAAIERLERAGLAASIERGETCCYANQTKVWAIDPEGRPWEVYTVHEETEARDDENASCCAAEGEERTCCAVR
jgi:catechol 2,3-dioxygenase-like lactoylglutathione lyase family enzyme